MLNITPNTPYDIGLQPPTDLKLSTASKGGIFNGDFESGTPDSARTTDGWIANQRSGWYLDAVATAVSAEFDTSAAFRGKQALLIETTDATGTAVVYNTQGVTLTNLEGEAIPLKASTSYVLHGFIRPANVEASGAFFDIAQYDSAAVVGTTSTSDKLTGDGGGFQQKWRHIKLAFTSDADAAWGRIGLHNDVANNVSRCWFDNFYLEEVVTDTTATNKVVERIRPVLQAVTSNGTDQSLDTGGAYANTYTLTTAVNEGATHRQTFTPTKKYVSRIGVWVVAKGTGNWDIVVHDASNNFLAASRVTGANLTNGQMNYFDAPYIWTSGALHFHIISTVADGTVKSNTDSDLEDASFIQNYSKKAQTMEIVCNGIASRLTADADGILSDAVLDIDNAKYTYYYNNASTNSRYGIDAVRDVYSYTAGGKSHTPGYPYSNGWSIYQDNGVTFKGPNDATQRDIIYKVNTLLPIRHVRGIVKLLLTSAGNAAFEIAVSVDNQNYTSVLATGTGDAAAGDYRHIFETDIVNGASYFFLRMRKTSAVSNDGIMGLEMLNIDLDTLKIPQSLFYPINTINQFTETIKLLSVATRVYFNLPNSFFVNNVGTWPIKNKDDAILPNLVFTDGNGYYIGHLFLNIDNTQETSPCVAIVKAETTNGQASGTGSDSGDAYILNDGEYMTLSTAVAEIKLVYRVGTGTTTFSNITKNTYYLSSNGSDDVLTQDPSHQFNAIVGIRQQGMLQRVLDLGDELASIRKSPIIPKNELLAVGTAYTLTTSLAVVNFATSGNLELFAIDPGIYEITLDAMEDLSAVTASAAANYSLYQLYLDNVAIANTERLGTGISILTVATVGLSKQTVHLSWFIQVFRPGQLISVYAKQNGATTGAWTIATGTTGQTRLGWKKIA